MRFLFKLEVTIYVFQWFLKLTYGEDDALFPFKTVQNPLTITSAQKVAKYFFWNLPPKVHENNRLLPYQNNFGQNFKKALL